MIKVRLRITLTTVKNNSAKYKFAQHFNTLVIQVISFAYVN